MGAVKHCVVIFPDFSELLPRTPRFEAEKTADEKVDFDG